MCVYCVLDIIPCKNCGVVCCEYCGEIFNDFYKHGKLEEIGKIYDLSEYIDKSYTDFQKNHLKWCLGNLNHSRKYCWKCKISRKRKNNNS